MIKHKEIIEISTILKLDRETKKEKFIAIRRVTITEQIIEIQNDKIQRL